MDDDILTSELEGAVAQYDDTLLFIGFELGAGAAQIMVYPQYRFPGDDRVHGQIGILEVPWGTPWADILAGVDEVSATALRNYRRCAAMRAGRSKAARGVPLADHGADYVADQFRESWAAIRLRLEREGCAVRGGVTFAGDPARPFLATYEARPYTVRVYPTGSALVVPDDRRAELERLEGRE